MSARTHVSWRCTLAGAMVLAAGLSGAGDLGELRRRGVLEVLSVSLAGSSPAAESAAQRAGERPGFEREILEGFARLQQLRIEVLPVKLYDDLIPALLAGRGDVIAGVFTVTEARAQQVDFTVETFPTRNVILSRRPRPVIRTLAQLRALGRIGALQGASDWQALLDAGVAESALVPLSGDTLESLRARRFEAVIQQVETAMAASRADPDLQVGMYLGPAGSYAFGVRKESPELRAALSDYVANMRRGGGWNRLVVKYYGSDAAELLKRIRE